MSSALRLAPGIPADYYRRIFEFEERHFWYRGMRAVASSLCGRTLARSGARLLDAGCGTGGFLRWALDRGSFAYAAGVDIGGEAIELAQRRVPEADLHTALLSDLPFDDACFDLVVCNDVLQHVPEDDVETSLRELHRVLEPNGTLLVRTNGSRRLRRERHDWRAYDRATLAAQLEHAGFVCERLTHANMVLSLYSELRGRRPHAPLPDADGIPSRPPGRFMSAVGGLLLGAEARWLAGERRTLPFGHTLFAVACPR